MGKSEQYALVIATYELTGSINQTVERLGISKIKVQRILITEGLWCSKSSLEIGELYAQGLSTAEIAEKLHVSIKNVQAYLPYTRGSYGDHSTNSANWSAEYRRRMKTASERMIKGKVNHIDLPSVDTNNTTSNPIPNEPKSDNTAYKLKLELVKENESSINNKTFLKLAKAEKGISRTVIISGNMTLHSMHYMIQRLFGWQNAHFHNFSLSRKLFGELVSDDRDIWCDLVGTLFYYDIEDSNDLLCDDDYYPEKSISTWLKEKYTNNHFQAICETYSENRDKIKLLQKTKHYKSTSKLSELFIDEEPNYLLERLTIKELMINSSSKPLPPKQWLSILIKNAKDAEFKRQEIFDNDAQRDHKLGFNLELYKLWTLSQFTLKRLLNENRSEIRRFFNQSPEEAVEEHKKTLEYLYQECAEIINFSPKIEPNLTELFYHYDYSDGWCIKITCEDIIANDDEEKPKCIAADGLNVLDDVGGIAGFYDFLKSLNSRDESEKERLRKKASRLGWNGKKTKPENML